MWQQKRKAPAAQAQAPKPKDAAADDARRGLEDLSIQNQKSLI
jgi:hypothetical protein